jgi:hypothetical protein
VNQGDDAYNGRTLDEKVVNPFLHERRIPSSKGPFLAAFRRSVRFDESTREGLRDKESYGSLLSLIKLLKKAPDEKALQGQRRINNRLLSYWPVGTVANNSSTFTLPYNPIPGS